MMHPFSVLALRSLHHHKSTYDKSQNIVVGVSLHPIGHISVGLKDLFFLVPVFAGSRTVTCSQRRQWRLGLPYLNCKKKYNINNNKYKCLWFSSDLINKGSIILAFLFTIVYCQIWWGLCSQKHLIQRSLGPSCCLNSFFEDNQLKVRWCSAW